MPLVRIALPQHRFHQAATGGDCVHRAMVETIGAPAIQITLNGGRALEHKLPSTGNGIAQYA